MRLQMTTWQTVGPFFRIGMEHLFKADIAGEGVAGVLVAVQGRLLDGDGLPISDAVIEIWQANAYGKYAHPEDTQDKLLEQEFRGFGRIPTDEGGYFRFTTIKPGPVPGPGDSLQAPHLVVCLLMRGLLRGLVTRAYFPDEPLNQTDAVLSMIEPTRRSTLIMRRSLEDAAHTSEYAPGNDNLLTWQINMQGDHETVFLEF